MFCFVFVSAVYQLNRIRPQFKIGFLQINLIYIQVQKSIRNAKGVLPHTLFSVSKGLLVCVWVFFLVLAEAVIMDL